MLDTQNSYSFTRVSVKYRTNETAEQVMEHLKVGRCSLDRNYLSIESATITETRVIKMSHKIVGDPTQESLAIRQCIR